MSEQTTKTFGIGPRRLRLNLAWGSRWMVKVTLWRLQFGASSECLFAYWVRCFVTDSNAHRFEYAAPGDTVVYTLIRLPTKASPAGREG